MKKISLLDRLLLFATGLIAAYQIALGVEGGPSLAVASFTIAFGVLLVSALLLIIFGFEILDSPLVLIVTTLIPLGLSLGLVVEYFPEITTSYLVFVIVGWIAVIITRIFTPGRPAVIILAVVHGIAGLIIFLLPIYLVLINYESFGFILVSVGGALIGVGGLLLSFLKTGRPILSQKVILSILPGLLLLTTIAFVVGFLAI